MSLDGHSLYIVYNNTAKTAKLYHKRSYDFNLPRFLMKSNVLESASFITSNISVGTSAPTGDTVIVLISTDVKQYAFAGTDNNFSVAQRCQATAAQARALAGRKGIANIECIDTAFTHNFKFMRAGFNGTYAGGTATIPYTAFVEDGATLIAGSGVRCTVACRLTAVTFQFGAMAGNATAFYRINGGSWVSFGTVTSATTFNTFTPASLSLASGDLFEVGFSSASSGSFTQPTVTAYIREPL
jgi:hypothetical protein